MSLIRKHVAVLQAWACLDLVVLNSALLEWISEYAVRAYITADSAVSYLNHARIA